MLRYLTAGESHGKGLMVILDGMPSGLKIDRAIIDRDLARRMKGYGRGGRMSIEQDTAEIVAGIRRDTTIGSPLGMLIKNRDHKIEELPELTSPRPGHADLPGIQKHGFAGARNVLERASARETAARVAAGAVARQLLLEFGILLTSHVTRIGGVEAHPQEMPYDEINRVSEASDLRCLDEGAAAWMREHIDKARSEGDTLGGVFEVLVFGAPPGLGSCAQWDRRLDGALARAVMSIPAVKAVSIGDGVENATKPGSEAHDEISYDDSERLYGRMSNRAGGIEGGMTNGMPVSVKGFMKPIATLGAPLRSVDITTKKEAPASTERSDVTAVPACSVVAEACVAIEVASSFLEKFGGDSLDEVRRNHGAYMEALKSL